MGGWVRWLVAGCAAGGLATACGAAGFAWGVRASDYRSHPTRAYTVSTDPRKVREIKFLRELVMSAAEDRDRLERAVLARRDRAEKEEQLGHIARVAVASVADNLDRPLWLDGATRIHDRPDCWIVEGLVLESRGADSPPCGYFWAVEIERADGAPEVPYRARKVVCDLNVYEPDSSGRWVKVTTIRLDGDHAYPRLDYGP